MTKAVPHRHFIFSIPKILRGCFLFERKPLHKLSGISPSGSRKDGPSTAEDEQREVSREVILGKASSVSAGGNREMLG